MYSRIILWSVLSILVIMYHLLPSYYRQLFITRISSLSKLRNTKLFKFKANYLYSNGVLQVKSKFYATVISEREIVIISLAAREEECFCRNFSLRNYIHSFFLQATLGNVHILCQQDFPTFDPPPPPYVSNFYCFCFV